MLNFKRLLYVGAALLMSQAAWAQRPYYVMGFHPSVKITSLRPTSSNTSAYAVLTAGQYSVSQGQPNTGGMFFMNDGRLLIAGMSANNNGGAWSGGIGNILGGPGYLMLFSGITSATSGAGVSVTSTGSLDSLYEPSGAWALGDTLYVVDNKNGLTRRDPNGSGGYGPRQTVYKGLLGVMSGIGGSGDRRWDAGLLYKNGYFYSAVGNGLIVGGMTDMSNIKRGRGTVLKISKDGSTVDTVVGGIRNPVALNFGPDSEMFLADNQGSFRPESGIWHVFQGAFYGHPGTPFSNNAITPPAVIVPYGSSPSTGTATDPTISRVGTDFALLRDGPFKNQMLWGSNHTPGMNRVFMEKVAGEYQGAVFPFMQGMGEGDPGNSAGTITDLRCNIHRMAYGPDGRLYLGGGGGSGSSSQGAWGFQGMNLWGLARLEWTDSVTFEMKAIRSTGPTTMEVEFTEPVNPSTVTVAHFAVWQGGNLLGGTANDNSYGAGKWQQAVATLTPTAVSLDSTGTRATLTFASGALKQRSDYPGASDVKARAWGYVIQIHVTGVTAVSNHAMWGDGAGGGVGWYTMNSFGPGTDVTDGTGGVTSIGSSAGSKSVVRTLGLRSTSLGITVKSPVTEAYTLRVLDLRGKTLASFAVNGKNGDFLVPASALDHGMNWLEAKASNGQRWVSALPRP